MSKHKGKTRDEIAAAYASPPWWYDIRGFFILTFAYNSTLWAQLRFFGPNFGKKHIEVACGTATLLELILRWRRWKKLPDVEITGVDYAESMLAGAIRRFSGQDKIVFELADVSNLPFDSDSFDTANVANAIHCFPDVDGALKDIFRVLKPGGVMAANVLLYPQGIQPLKWIAGKINRWGIQKGILFTPYDCEDIRKRIISAGFVVSQEARLGNTYHVLANKPSVSTS